MLRSNYIKISLLSIFVLTIGVLLWGLNQRTEVNSKLSSAILKGDTENTPSPYPMRIEDFTYTTSKDNRLVARITADEFKVNPRKFFVFNINPFNEATITNAKMEVYLYEESPQNVDLFSFRESLKSLENKEKRKAVLKELGLVTRGVIKGLTLHVYKNDKLTFVVKAQRAHTDFRKNETKLMNVSVEDKTLKRNISSKSVIWDNKEKVFRVPGEYIMLADRKATKGKGLEIGLDFAAYPFK